MYESVYFKNKNITDVVINLIDGRYDGLAPRMDVLSWGRRNFQISFSNRDTSRNAWNRHWGSFMVDTGIL